MLPVEQSEYRTLPSMRGTRSRPLLRAQPATIERATGLCGTGTKGTRSLWG